MNPHTASSKSPPRPDAPRQPGSRPRFVRPDPRASAKRRSSTSAGLPDGQYLDPIDFETDCINLPVRGELPAGLVGTLYRNGPNPQFPDAQAHWFLGDGMIHAFRFAKGRVSCRNRWVRTARFDAERTAGRRLRRHMLSTVDDGAANTHVIGHRGRLYALEEAHAPIGIDPRSLTTLGAESFGNRYFGPFTAHPKIDPATGEMLFFGYATHGPLSAGMAFGAIDANGEMGRLARFDAPIPTLVHDFAITEHFVLFPVLPLVADVARAHQGGPAYAWEPAYGSRIGVLRRGADPSTLRWFDGDACFAFHVLNAFETLSLDGSPRVVIDVMRYDAPPLFPQPDGRSPDPRQTQARLCRWTLDTESRTRQFSQTLLDDQPGEFPRIDERATGRHYRHGWIAGSRRLAPDQSFSGDRIDSLIHYDLLTGRQDRYELDWGDRISEPIFAARPGSLDEGDGWLIAVVYRARENRSDLIVLDARDVARGPIATVLLPHRIPAGFHGSWLAQG